MIALMTQTINKQTRLLLQRPSLFVVLFSCLVLIGIVAFQVMQSKETRHYYNVTAWHSETAQGFFDSCVYTALRPGSGVSDEAAKAYCGCDIDAFQSIYKSDEELLQAQKTWAKTGYPTEVISAMRECAEKAHVPLNI